VDVLRVRVGWGAAVSDSHSIQYGREAGQTGNDAVVRALRSALEPLRRRGSTCSIVISDSLVRYATLPWRDEIADAPARQAYARAYLANMYGATAEAWEVVRDESAYGEPTAICALDRELLAGVRGVMRDAGLRLTSVRPYFSAAFNRCRREIAEHDFWFAVVEPGCICLARVAARSLRLVRSQRAGDDVYVELAAMIERESLVLDQASSKSRLYVFAPDVTPGGFSFPDTIDIHHVDPHNYLRPMRADVRCAMALA
jgi:hypothetical protein